ncbi:MAG: alanyl-tRNA editing protein [Anaerolineae bacterium]
MRLYYDDAYLMDFTARIAATVERGRRLGVVLDRTAFYPTSGGQPHDTGRLDQGRVVEVEEDQEGRVVHWLEGPLPEGEVQGHVDWERRFDHMQQHTGQHILSQACWQVLKGETIGFHLGDEESTIDLDIPHLDLQTVEPAEALANQVVWQDRPVIAQFVSEAELGSLPLRKPPTVRGEVRVVQVEEFDFSACGGTHVRRTGEVGSIVVTRTEPRGQETRVHFLCGARAARDHRLRVRLGSALTAALTVGLEELPQAVARLQGELRAARKEAREAQERLLDLETQALLARASALGGWKVVRHVFPEGQGQQMKWMAQHLTAGPSVVALLGMEGARGQLAFACSEDVTMDMAALLRVATETVGGGGGGGPRLAQGGGFPGDRLSQALEAAWKALQSPH